MYCTLYNVAVDGDRLCKCTVHYIMLPLTEIDCKCTVHYIMLPLTEIDSVSVLYII